MNNAMKYVIVAILASLFGAGIEFERGSHEIHASYTRLGIAYGCGNNAGMRHAIKTLKPDEELPSELPQCLDYRMLWEAMQ